MAIRAPDGANKRSANAFKRSVTGSFDELCGKPVALPVNLGKYCLPDRIHMKYIFYKVKFNGYS